MAFVQRMGSRSETLPGILGTISAIGLLAAVVGIFVGAMGWFWAGSVVFIVAGVAAIVLSSMQRREQTAVTYTRGATLHERQDRNILRSEADFITPPPPTESGLGRDQSMANDRGQHP